MPPDCLVADMLFPWAIDAAAKFGILRQANGDMACVFRAFYNEKLVTEVLKIGIGVGIKEWIRFYRDHVERKVIEKAITQV
ncbi:hypothetical protein GH714_033761 [Hevea brasiliensis]|uniref:Uncharacterized protein n=1 Tax=Hevea brasiliensis TaxID=3981 RepID=A0A6A6N6L4_HEVBR|nr:hypothetical protein GH714_033761 [Hevea brasiliensis]